MSDDERFLTSRAPWMGQRVCVVCQKVGFGVDEVGVCPTCARARDRRQDEIDWMSDVAKAEAQRVHALREIAEANERLAEKRRAKREGRNGG